ncbi:MULTISPECIES: potassium-transporting ATPase subunit KdpC [Metabacillus]|uniref:Potassium-transporting ATPase subunit KdpC n=1 Tax=Metabacillus hrfriensis TaxID=3048891 RepID=A0ACD4RJ24_9BACI|nr:MULTISPECIES: potassium-transporting ATPase subunit KdpC [Metabacillus]UAL54868.1 potassium-transporting ATPase subunit KdpC [Metabacillus dongyingensis]UOK59989.1 potassium-transporting ATPase subunit KdpC [Bacillus sp. OVS6]USK31132.1 potassium-transporting ATPase subunit KdpC [Bacillus sp. CMF21]WHZ60353.1 potassium-transporting ATPase subunit KdpC [Metabacillus sp. CT-WN-B3]
MEEKQSIMGPIIRMSLFLMVICGIIYPVAVTGIAQTISPAKANGSLVYDENMNVIGSELIGQSFSADSYFHGRISSIENNGAGSGSNNYAPSNADMIKRTLDSIEEWKKNNPETPVSEVPNDLLTNSGSGLDPHISPGAAYAQVKRISKATGIDQSKLENMIKQHTQGRELGMFGEEKVNVLQLNLALKNMLN